MHNDNKNVVTKPFASYCIRLEDLHRGLSLFIRLTIGYRHVPLVDLQGEKYIYSTLFVKINWSVKEIDRLVPIVERRVKAAKARPLKLEEASRSGTSIESNSSTISIPPLDEGLWLERAESSNVLELEKINEVNEAKDKL